VEVTLPNRRLIIFDGGTGIRELGNDLIRRNKKINATILLSHYHWDPIQGLPFFAPAYRHGHSLTVCGCRHSQFPLERAFSSQMESIHFPVKASSLAADIRFREIKPATDSIEGADLAVMRANHPGITFSYAVSFDNRKIVYMTDNEILPGSPRGRSHIFYDREEFIQFIKGADVLIHDAQYSDREYQAKKGWGHSPWKEAVKLGTEGEVRQLILFHHDPDHADRVIDAQVQQCRAIIRNMSAPMKCSAAQEGKTVYL
jgi:phosphoribosyl 1,2-cyclic phosphodiesterase